MFFASSHPQAIKEEDGNSAAFACVCVGESHSERENLQSYFGVSCLPENGILIAKRGDDVEREAFQWEIRESLISRGLPRKLPLKEILQCS